jgi:hypothetical protein
LGQNLINNKDSLAQKMPKFDLALPCERLHVRVCKQVLRVPRKSTNISVLAELGRLPMYNDVLLAVVKYYTRLESLSNSSLLHKVFMASKSLDNRTCNIMRFVEKQLNCFTENIDFKTKSVANLYISNMKQSLRIYFENCFFSFMQSDENRKLSTYKHIKRNYCIEPYLSCIEDPYIRKEVTCFRISAHSLRIEIGRYKNIDRDKRTCLICNSDEIEDEFHFMMACPEYRDLRIKYLYPILLNINNEYNYNEWEMFIKILTCTDNGVMLNVANFIQKAMMKRNCKVLKNI